MLTNNKFILKCTCDHLFRHHSISLSLRFLEKEETRHIFFKKMNKEKKRTQEIQYSDWFLLSIYYIRFVSAKVQMNLRWCVLLLLLLFGVPTINITPFVRKQQNNFFQARRILFFCCFRLTFFLLLRSRIFFFSETFVCVCVLENFL